MESRSFYETAKALDRISDESRQPARGTVAAGYVGSRHERRAQAAIDRRAAKKLARAKESI